MNIVYADILEKDGNLSYPDSILPKIKILIGWPCEAFFSEYYCRRWIILAQSNSGCRKNVKTSFRLSTFLANEKVWLNHY